MTVDVRIVQEVHRKVWDTTTYAPDHGDVWGNLEWHDGKAIGDCEEWADRTMDALKARGAPDADVAVMLCHTKGERGFDHAVCIVSVPELGLMTCGDAYDEAGPRPIKATGYSFHSFMRLNQPGVWRTCPEGWPDD